MFEILAKSIDLKVTLFYSSGTLFSIFMKTILITGGAGFIGSHVCQRLIKQKGVKKVVCIDNLNSDYPVRFKKENLALLSTSKKFKFYKADIRNKAALKKVFQKERPEYVIHLAAKTDTRLALEQPHEYVSTNIAGTVNVLEFAKDVKVKKFIFISSSSLYGNSRATLPQKEDEIFDLPLSLYGATKRAGEIITHSYYFNYGLHISCLRLFNVYGERMRPGPVISRWTQELLDNKTLEISGKGTRKRDFTYVGDVVDAIVRSLTKGTGHDIFNISASRPISLKELLGTLEKVSGMKAQVRSRPSSKVSIDVSHGDIRQAKKILGWEPKVNLEKGLSRYVTWFKGN